MEISKKKHNKLPLALIGFVSVLVAMVLLLWSSTTHSNQSSPAFYPKVYFEGQYRIGDGPWMPVEKGQHIPATQGDVTMTGLFHMTAPTGEYLGIAPSGTPLAFYMYHLHITVDEPGMPSFAFDIDSNLAGNNMCGESCELYALATDEPVTLTFRNPHRFGNDNAIDRFLAELSVYADLAFEKDFMAQGNTQRYIGLALVLVALVLLGIALCSALLRVEGGSKLALAGLCILFAGSYFIFSAIGISFWNHSIAANTTIRGLSMMLYMLCVCALITSGLCCKCHRVGMIATFTAGATCVAIATICMITGIHFYDTWLWWALIQSLVNITLLVCLIMNFFGASKVKKVITLGAIAMLLAFEVDFAGTYFGWWQSGLICKHIFFALLAIALVMVWQIIPISIRAARKTKEMEAEQKAIRVQLQENRIAIMISQIQPHFIYNTLGTIQHLCKEDPEQAAKLVHSFSLYLRGNFSELDSTVPIRFLQELEHVRCYTQIEQVRFPDMTIRYNIQADEFLLPALTVQPLVENAIKHGLMGLEQGGTVTISTYETPTHYCVKVTDDGVGFDEASLPEDRKKHIGIRNVRERLDVMCGGSLTVESHPGQGTVALIQIPKEGKAL